MHLFEFEFASTMIFNKQLEIEMTASKLEMMTLKKDLKAY